MVPSSKRIQAGPTAIGKLLKPEVIERFPIQARSARRSSNRQRIGREE
jgi:hypothetical protein